MTYLPLIVSFWCENSSFYTFVNKPQKTHTWPGKPRANPSSNSSKIYPSLEYTASGTLLLPPLTSSSITQL
ncbi:hypothetical protein HanPSC8_Chr10g0444221 [Helianthus annuus]|nr:hypothetical protein HanPSC8_Chr10g0444221 [Helianthus annuus]